ncbi:MAG: lysophospholipid acyltransferase family protein [Eubacteriales bacterium]|nr:lysophospholipid acyltransferase family protein [Eubacteriales bacterium]
MKKKIPLSKFDMAKLPVRTRWYLRPLTWLLSFPEVWARRLTINHQGVALLKPPYLLLCTHMSFVDFKVTTAAIFPHPANYVVAIDGFIGREWLLRNAGGILKRKFTHDLTMIKHIKRVTDQGGIVALYPEARYSLIGTTAVLPDSLGKIVRLLGVPVVTLRMHGDYLISPCWNLAKRNVPLTADLTQIISASEAKSLALDEMNERIRKSFDYDEYRWQQEQRIRIDYANNAQGLHKVLYQCPSCKMEQTMDSAGNSLWCTHCGKQWTLSPYGELAAVAGETEFSHPPDWYEFQRREVRRQIELGQYEISDEVDIDILPNARGYVNLGRGKLTHNLSGFTLEANFEDGPLNLQKSPASMYSCHIEYNYDRRGDCIDLSTLSDTYYIYPLNQRNCVTKIALATEELFAYLVPGIKKEAKP